jgi:phospholipid transport system substrate-binding protein
MSLHRRHFVAAVAVGCALFGTGNGVAWAADDAVLAQAAEFVRQAGNKLGALAAAEGDPEDRRKRLMAFIDGVADVDGVARFSIGRFWRLATPAQQQEYLALFHRVLFKNVTTQMGDYTTGAPAKVTVAKPVQTDVGINVPTTVERAGAAPVHVTWLVEMDSGKPRIGDIVAEGMSLRLTLRSDYTSFITRNNGEIEALLAALRQQAGS